MSELMFDHQGNVFKEYKSRIERLADFAGKIVKTVN